MLQYGHGGRARKGVVHTGTLQDHVWAYVYVMCRSTGGARRLHAGRREEVVLHRHKQEGQEGQGPHHMGVEGRQRLLLTCSHAEFASRASGSGCAWRLRACLLCRTGTHLPHAYTCKAHTYRYGT